MALFAQINENNLVLQVIVIDNSVVNNLPFPESEPIGVAFCQELFGTDTNWVQTSDNASFRYNCAGTNYVFDPIPTPYGAFISPKRYPSWLLNTETYKWQAPVPYPNDEKLYYWDEQAQEWVLFPDQIKV